MTPSALLDRARVRPLLLDGGLGSLLIAMGLEPGRAPEHWNLEHPERVTEVHRRYAAAGSDLVHANTFGATPLKLAAAGLAGRCAEINARAVELARAAVRGTPALIAGDVGPSGAFLPPVGEASLDELAAGYAEQCAALAGAGVDLLSIETMYDRREALAAVRAAAATGLPVLCSLTFEARPRGCFTIMGDALAATLAELAGAGAHAVGLNCTVTSEAMLGMVREARAGVPAAVPIVAQPNAGQPRPTAAGIVYDASPDGFAADLVEMARSGAAFVGGCCGTDPEFIRRAAVALAAAGLR